MQTCEGENYNVRWENAPVAMPILSTREVARNSKQLEYDEYVGHIIDKTTGKTTFCLPDNRGLFRAVVSSKEVVT